MPSPFPGMNPYLEEPSGWSSVHTALFLAIQPSDYRVFICRREEYPETWALNLRDELPSIPIPITPDVPPASLDLCAALNRVHAEGRYTDEVDYSLPPVPPLRSLDGEWAADLLKKPARKRKK